MHEALHVDGVQLLRFIETQAGTMFVSDLVLLLWKDFLKAKKSYERISVEPSAVVPGELFALHSKNLSNCLQVYGLVVFNISSKQSSQQFTLL